MPKPMFADVLQYLRNVCAVQDARERADSELLKRFLASREQAAFAVLMQRHGPMVFKVCQRVLGDSHAAEDCFQATFIALVRRAASIRLKDSLGTWLYAVALRIAVKARARTAAQRIRERRLIDMPQSEPLDDLTWQELRCVLDEEIGRLPEKYRAAIVLCHLEGKSHSQAAKELGWPKNSVTNRLAHGQELLRQQLVRRGISLSAGLLATALCEKAAAAPVRALLTINTVKAAMSVAAGKAVVGGCVSATAMALAEEAMKGMAGVKGLLAVVFLALGLGIGGAGLAGYGSFVENKRPGKAIHLQTPPAKAEKRGPEKKNTPLATDLYGDPLPEGALGRLGTIRFRHDALEVSEVAFSPDGKVLASSGFYGFCVCLWDAATGRPLHRLAGPLFCNSLAFSPDGKTLFAAGDRVLSFIEVATGKELRKLEGTFNGLPSAAFSSNGRMVAVGNFIPGGARLVLWDVVTRKELRRMEWNYDETRTNARPPSIAFSPDDKYVAWGSIDKMVHLWDVATGKELHRLKGHQDVIWSVAFAGKGKVLTSVGQDGFIRRWEVETGKPLPGVKTNDANLLTGVAFAPGGKLLASGTFDGFGVWDLETGKELRRWPVPVGNMAFSPDGRVLATVFNNALRMWDIATGKELHAVESPTGRIHSLEFTPDGKTLFSLGWDRKALSWNLATSRAGSELFSGPLGTFKNTSYLTAADLSSDGKIAALAAWFGPPDERADPAVHLVDTSTGKELYALNKHSLVRSLKISPDAKLLASIDKESLRLWDVALGTELFRLEGQHDPEGPLAFSFDNKLLAYSGVDGSICLLEVAKRKELRRWITGQKYWRALVFSPDGKFIAAIDTANGRVCVWACATGKEVLQFDGKKLQPRILFSASGRTIIASGFEFRNVVGGDREFVSTIQIREMLTGQEIRQITTAQRFVDCLALTPDGRTLASGGTDSSILFWDLTGQARNGMAKPGHLTKAQLDGLWSDLAGDAPKADRALWSLALTPAESFPYLKAQMQPLPPAPAEQVAKLIADLESERFAVRQKAAQALVVLGEAAESALRQTLEGKITLEVRQRIELILRSRGKDVLRNLRAIGALEQIGTPEARQELVAIANGTPNPRVAAAASAALLRLSPRPE